LLQGLQKRRKRGLASWIVRDEPKKYADAAYSVDLLRARREPPCGRAAENRDELATSHGSPEGRPHNRLT
jgi:hypothetical protein